MMNMITVMSNYDIMILMISININNTILRLQDYYLISPNGLPSRVSYYTDLDLVIGSPRRLIRMMRMADPSDWIAGHPLDPRFG